MEKALSMFSEDFGSFMRPHPEPLAFPGKCWGPWGRGDTQAGDSRCVCHLPGQRWP